MKLRRKTTSAIGISRWAPLLVLLARALNGSFSSEATTIASAVDVSGEIENLAVDSTLSIKDKTKESPLELANAQFDWIISKGGSVDRDKVAIQPVNEDYKGNPTNLGIFAVNDIKKGDVLMKIPASVVLTSRHSKDACDAALTLLFQTTRKGNSSAFMPYINYLYSSDEIASTPSTWSLGGKSLLASIQGTLIPDNIVEASFANDCVEEGDEEEFEKDFSGDKIGPLETAYKIALTRSWEGHFVPVLDMFNHHPRADIDYVHDKKSKTIVVTAEHDIRKGEEIYSDYRPRSPNSFQEFHVSTFLRDFGFVEDFPQQWLLPTPRKRSNHEENEIPPDIRFSLYKRGNDFGEKHDMQSVKKNFEIEWISPGEPVANPIAADHLRKELARIEEMRSVVEEQASVLPSQVERETVLNYYESLTIAYMSVIASIEEAIQVSPTFFEDEGDNYMACSDWDMLHEETYGWEYFDRTESSFQEIEFYMNPETRDACLFLEQYLHACVSNRPHYHEVFVHYPAYFLEKVERVLFIGGGDSMVLHEVLKYDDQLELVVGLELDQHVVRSTYSRIGTQPHFHNEKVEWWFGDAAQTLNILPTEYYGTFDLVIVDILSEVAEALEVTKETTIMEAAMMLMKPSGIIVKNEDEGYVPGSTDETEFTKYTADVMYYDVPVYCLQTFVMGSNSVDFSTAQPYDHKISNFYLKGVDEFQSQFDTWYTTGKQSVDEEGGKDEHSANSEEETNTSAMTMILEVEEISVPITKDSASSIQESIHKSAEAVGFTFKTSFQSEFLGGFHVISILEEAVVVARCFQENNYCALDIQFWKSVHMAESLKKAILSGLRSNEHSIYRIITTGVFGVEENDNNRNIGPPKSTPEAETTLQDVSEGPESTSESQTTFVERKNKEISFKNATFEDYDSTSALAQWHSQQAVAFQNIIRYDLPFRYKLDKMKQMIGEVVHDAIQGALKGSKVKSVGQITVEDIEIGRGVLIMFTWSEGDVVALWDGEGKLNLNMFALDRHARIYAGSITKGLKRHMDIDSVDFFPRGFGRTVSLPRDIEARNGYRNPPFWAPRSIEDEEDDVDDDNNGEL